ncbi:MAG: substrate-binding domain-containing protein [Gammaproteobacteria bacterium]|nr:substrate-binding domain-containing protein [Gammaproteobacteria bacterium]
MTYKFFYGAALSLLISLSATSQAEPLRGLSFTSPESTIKMPPGWELKSVDYGEKVKEADLVISFGQQTHPALHKITEQYAREHNLKLVIQSGTCGVSAGKLLRKAIDSGTFCCPPGSKDRLPGLEYHTVAISALSVFVNAENPVSEISTQQARQIFQGKIRNWSDLKSGGNFEHKVRPHARLHCKKRPGHWTLLLKNQSKFGPTLKEIGVIPDLVAKVGQLKDAVSIETPFMIETYQKGPVKILKVDGHLPTDIDYVASGKYPFYRTYSMTTWSNGGKKREQVVKLVRFLQAYIENHAEALSMVPVSKLKQAGWEFKKNELIAEPDGSKLAHIPPRH